MLVFTVYYFALIQGKNANLLVYRKRKQWGILLYAFLFIVIVGFRPVSYAFGDTINYARTFEKFSSISEIDFSSKDTLFYLFMWRCSKVMSVHWFFFIIEILYVVPLILACYRLFKNGMDLSLVFTLSAFSFFTYGVNGIRNGVSLSLVLLALTFISGRFIHIIVCAVLSFVAISFHASAALPVVCMIAALFVKNRRFMFYFWAFSILVSLLFGGAVGNFFAGLGFDDRLSDYILADVDETLFSHTGFRWDFLLYSMIPIALGYYFTIKRRVYDSTYLRLLGTYIYANAFWIMIIRAEYSNRFAYLSWFLYPIVLAYPLLKLRIWPKTQGKKAALIMLGHFAFTFLMAFVLD